jgi:hypothetical protein
VIDEYLRHKRLAQASLYFIGGGIECHHINVPALEAGQSFFDMEPMEFVTGIGLEGKGAKFNKVIHAWPRYK